MIEHPMKNHYLFVVNVAALLVLTIGSKPDSRIIGGRNATEGQFPFAAAIQVQTEFNRFFCGGAVIRNRWVITSAHCVYDAILLTIQLGSLSLTTPDPKRITVSSSEYHIHPYFSPQTFQHDIALIKLRTNVTENDSVNDTGLVGTELPSDTSMMAFGWGQISDSNPELSEYLQYVKMVSISTQECQIFYGEKITNLMVCAQGSYIEGTCIGDTGGPLIIDDGTFRVAGVASFISSSGCDNNQPSGFTRVSSYYDWIKSIVDD